MSMDQRVFFSTNFQNILAEQLNKLSCDRAMLITTHRQLTASHTQINDLKKYICAVFPNAVTHTPVSVTRSALAIAKDKRIDCVISIGGGSTTGLGKSISFNTGYPHIAIPTTYSGSESTPILGETSNGTKTTFTNPAVLPEIVIYDPNLVVSLPKHQTITSGLNALAHAIEALYGKNVNIKTTRLALDGITYFYNSLQKVANNPSDLAARELTLRGAWCCGAVLGHVGMALHHKLCHTLGGAYHLPHADTHAIILPHAIAFNRPFCEKALMPIKNIFNCLQPEIGLWNFICKLGAPTRLKDLGVTKANLIEVAENVIETRYWNPRPLTAKLVHQVLLNAWAGNPPEPFSDNFTSITGK